MSTEELSKQPSPSPELTAGIDKFLNALKDEVLPNDSILERATPRWEYRECAKFRRNRMSNECLTCTYNAPAQYCQGPYLYLYWKEKGKLRKKYIGKYDSPNDYFMGKLEKFMKSKGLGNS